ncbi:MAG: hypothetical protein EON58_10430 [Alphaproteobacteria bacterium]|nr:MAG: hypothetical protein EON58_10430 [Alphaproteobacteria bacterium]
MAGVLTFTDHYLSICQRALLMRNRERLLDLPPKPDVRSVLLIVLPMTGALFVGLAAPTLVQPVAVALTDHDALPTLQSGLFAASGVGSIIAVGTAVCAVVCRSNLIPGWRAVPDKYAILRRIYLGCAALLFLTGL